MYSVHKQDDTGIHSLEHIVQAVLTGTHYDINELKPIYATYNRTDLDKGRTSWTLKQAIGERLLQHGGSNEQIIEEEEDKQAVGKRLLEHAGSKEELKRLLEHAGSKEELIEDERRSSTGIQQDITKKQKLGHFGWIVTNQ